jgi:ribosomal protein S6
MVRYETLILSVPEITVSEQEKLEKDFAALITKNKGKVATFDRWGKYALAYTVRKNDYGVYFLARFEIEEQEGRNIQSEITTFFKLRYSELIMRFMATHIDETARDEYRRPQSLDETTEGNVDKFIKDNKMDGILRSANKRNEKTEAKPVATEEAVVASQVDVKPVVADVAPKADSKEVSVKAVSVEKAKIEAVKPEAAVVAAPEAPVKDAPKAVADDSVKTEVAVEKEDA